MGRKSLASSRFVKSVIELYVVWTREEKEYAARANEALKDRPWSVLCVSLAYLVVNRYIRQVQIVE
jgi:hypothetical protein